MTARLHTLVGAVPLGLTVLAEGAWVAVLAGVINVYARQPAALDLWAMAGFVLLGMLAAWLFGRRLGPRWPAVAALLGGAAALAGILVAPSAREALSDGVIDGLAKAAATNPGGIFAGLALLRGIAWGHASVPLSEDRLGRLFAGGLAAISIGALIGNPIGEPFHSPFVSQALADGLVFVATALVALALTRQAHAAGDAAAAWQRNPAWVAALLLLVAASLVGAVALSGQVAPALTVALGVSLVPIVVLGLIIGWSRRGVVLFVLIVTGAALLAALGFAIDQMKLSPKVGSAPGGPIDQSVDVASLGAIGMVVIVAAIVVVMLLVRLWMRQLRPETSDYTEERFIDLTPEPAPRRRPRRSWLPFGREPVDATSAYRALLADLAPRPGVARGAAETPREHAMRLRKTAGTGLALELLAADYALVEFGATALSGAENRRAVGRWRRLRDHLRPAKGPIDAGDVPGL